MAWGNLGVALRVAGRTEEAIEASSRALKVFREFEDWYGAGRALSNLAEAHSPVYARAHWLQAADACTRGNAPAEATRARARAEALTAPAAPTDKPAPASPPARTTDSAQPAPPPQGAPGTAAR
ncbi:tetratricopeptide repeat protein [Streptomyces sp. NPDC016566]|uniref:tetratricopeptide repeat protein n=1 Tax=Streptomyces sp. NPDC016566 TaxID=3364967 RepID=UPI003701020F